jgi:hypothetical protein
LVLVPGEDLSLDITIVSRICRILKQI